MRKTVVALLLLLSLPAVARAQDPHAMPAGHPGAEAKPAPAAPAPLTPEDEQKVLYALGVALWRNVASFDLTPAEAEAVSKALLDSAAGKAGAA